MNNIPTVQNSVTELTIQFKMFNFHTQGKEPLSVLLKLIQIFLKVTTVFEVNRSQT